MNLGLKGKSAIVCGASQGLGRACAEALAEEGVNIVLCSRNFDRVFQAARGISETYGTEAIPIAADLTQPDTPAKLTREVLSKFGGVDILINNAGGPRQGGFDDCDDEAWESAFRLTLMSVVRMSRAVLPVMTEKGWGRIINLASISVKQPIPKLLLSNSMRSAVMGLAKTLADEVADKGVLVNTIATGIFDTKRLRLLLETRSQASGRSVQAERDKMTATIPVSRIGSPEELAWFVTFLASERSSYITGTTIQVDGGLYQGMI